MLKNTATGYPEKPGPQANTDSGFEDVLLVCYFSCRYHIFN